MQAVLKAKEMYGRRGRSGLTRERALGCAMPAAHRSARSDAASANAAGRQMAGALRGGAMPALPHGGPRR